MKAIWCEIRPFRWLISLSLNIMMVQLYSVFSWVWRQAKLHESVRTIIISKRVKMRFLYENCLFCFAFEVFFNKVHGIKLSFFLYSWFTRMFDIRVDFWIYFTNRKIDNIKKFDSMKIVKVMFTISLKEEQKERNF